MNFISLCVIIIFFRDDDKLSFILKKLETLRCPFILALSDKINDFLFVEVSFVCPSSSKTVLDNNRPMQLKHQKYNKS